MYARSLLTVLSVLGLSLWSLPAMALSTTDLRCEYRTNPLGIDTAVPRLGWKLESKDRGVRQTAYHVLVASSPELLSKEQGDLWDSGKVGSDQSVHVAYAGSPLTSRQYAYWKVCVWDEAGKKSKWSEPARWSMGLLAPEDWTGQWIGVDWMPENLGPQ